MSYLHKFGPNDVFFNTLETHPSYEFTMYSGSAYLNNESFRGGNIPTGSISLYELNVNRISASLGGQPYPYQQGDRTPLTPFNWTFYVQSFMVKDGNYLTFKNTTLSESARQDYGTFLEGKYPLTSSIEREYIFPNALPRKHDAFEVGVDGLAREQETDIYFRRRKRMIALSNTINDYKRYSPVFDYNIFTSSNDGYSTGTGLVTGAVNLLSVPAIMIGSGIERGSVSLKFYYTGSLLDEAKDIRQNGELVSTMGNASGTVVGMVLYDQGFVLLTSSAPIGPNDGETTNQFARDAYTGTRVSTGVAQQDVASWLYFGSYRSGALGQRHGTQENRNYYPSASLWKMSFRGTSKIPTTTMFAAAKAGEVNNSQNPTWVSSSHANWQETFFYDSSSYIEPKEVPLKNTIQSPYCNYEEGFEKQVFISKIGIYDDEKNLLAVAKLANPVRKKESESFTFKLKMDF